MTIDPDGPYGINTAMRERQAYEAKRAKQELDDAWKRYSDHVSSSNNTSSSYSSSTSSKVICTELMRQGLYNKKDYVLGARYVDEYLTDIHVNGYHAWGIAVVRKMRNSTSWTKVFRAMAKSRADHIAYLYGDTSRKNLFGKVLCMIGEPACFIIGKFSGAQDWQSLYSGQKQKL